MQWDQFHWYPKVTLIIYLVCLGDCKHALPLSPQWEQCIGIFLAQPHCYWYWMLSKCVKWNWSWWLDRILWVMICLQVFSMLSYLITIYVPFFHSYMLPAFGLMDDFQCEESFISLLFGTWNSSDIRRLNFSSQWWTAALFLLPLNSILLAVRYLCKNTTLSLHIYIYICTHAHTHIYLYNHDFMMHGNMLFQETFWIINTFFVTGELCLSYWELCRDDMPPTSKYNNITLFYINVMQLC